MVKKVKELEDYKKSRILVDNMQLAKYIKKDVHSFGQKKRSIERQIA